MADRYEFINEYSETNFLFCAGRGNYVTPHLHREYELGYVISNSMTMRVKSDIFHLPQGSLWLINPFESHEPDAVRADRPNDFIQLKLPFSFFKSFFPDAYGVSFQEHHLSTETIGSENAAFIRKKLIHSALAYFRKEPYYSFECAIDILQIFHCLLQVVPHSTLDEAKLKTLDERSQRMQRITRTIEENFDTKLLLSDIAEEEHLSLPYLSRFFKESFGMSFQDYLTLYRCSRARDHLLSSDLSISDISLICGFSNPKYLRKGFRKHFGMEVSGLRKLNLSPDRIGTTHSDESKEHIYSAKEAIRMLENI